jgi:hypothetical protein
MPFPLPHFLRRRWLLHRAGRALERHAPEETLRLLDDPLVAGTRLGPELRTRALDELGRLATLAAERGELEAARSLIARLERADPVAGGVWRARVDALPRPSDPAAAPERADALKQLLVTMRAQKRQVVPPAARASSPGQALVVATRGRASEPCTSFRLAVDDAGEFLVVSARELALGHLRSTSAHLRFLADVDAEHVRLRLVEDFHQGARWLLVPVSARRPRVNGQVLSAESHLLCDGDRVELSGNLAFCFRAPEPASSSALLELLRGAECEGVARILLFVPGAAGCVRLGRKRTRHILVHEIEHEIELELERESQGEVLRVRCAGGVGGPSQPARTDGAVLPVAEVPVPPSAPVQLLLRAREARRGPFAIVVSALDESTRPSAGRPPLGADA